MPHTDAYIFAQLACLKRQQEALEPNQHIAARTLKEQAIGLVEAWFDGEKQAQQGTEVKHCRRCGFPNFAGGDTHPSCQPIGAEDDRTIDDAEQLAAARAHVSAALARITKEIEEGRSNGTMG